MDEKIAAVKWMFGGTDADARKFLRSSKAKIIQTIVDYFHQQMEIFDPNIRPNEKGE